jgi:hypothetical protein
VKYTNGTTIKTIASADGSRQVDLVARDDGMFQWHEHVWTAGDEYTGPYWAPGWMSGLYSTAQLAERGAVGELPWFRDQISN